MERSAWPKNLSSSRKHAIQELLHGQNPMKTLGDLFDAQSQTGNNTGQPLFAEDLVVNALRSFSNTVSQSSGAESDEVLQVPSNACVRSEVSEGSESIHTPVPRGYQWRTYDHKSILNSKSCRKTLDTQTRLDHNLIDDGHRWRKYGQQAVPNSDYPRNYFSNNNQSTLSDYFTAFELAGELPDLSPDQGYVTSSSHSFDFIGEPDFDVLLDIVDL